jgi:hypothetical protein
MWPDMNYVGQKPVDVLDLHIYPDGDTSFTLYEDDGESFNYLEGAVAVTKITSSAATNEVSISIGPRTGSYEGMPATRRFNLHIHADSAPVDIRINDEPAGADAWHYDNEAREILVNVSEDTDRQTSATVVCRWN